MNMNMDYLKTICSLEGRPAIVTGAGNGIGRAAARAMAALGARVTLIGRREINIQAAAQEICAEGLNADWYVVDQSDVGQIDAFFNWYYETHGIPYAVVANAGINLQQTVSDTTEEGLYRVIRNNFVGTFQFVRQSGTLMKKGHGGTITIVTSINARQAVYTEAAYSAIKAGLENLTCSAAIELSEYGIRVNAMAPGATITGMSDLPLYPDKHERFNRAIPLGHVAAPEEMGDVIALMCTDAFRYMTGSTVTVDGGLLLRKSVF